MEKEKKEFKGRRNVEEREEDQRDKMVEKLICVNRVAKSTKGGRKMSFAALVVVGDRAGKVGYALGKANDVSEAIRKATSRAHADMKDITLKKVKNASGEAVNVTIPNEVIGQFKSASVVMKPARPGTGVIAGGTVRAICDAAGITDILSKSLGSNTKVNIVKAVFAGFDQFFDGGAVAKAREKSLSEMWS